MIPDDADVCFIRVLDYAIRYTLDHVMQWNLALTSEERWEASDSSFVEKLMLNGKIHGG